MTRHHSFFALIQAKSLLPIFSYLVAGTPHHNTERKGTLLGVYAFAIPLTSPIFQLLSKQIHVYIPAIVRVCYRPFTINYYPLQWGEIPKEHRARCGGTDVLIRRRQRVQETAERQR